MIQEKNKICAYYSLKVFIDTMNIIIIIVITFCHCTLITKPKIMELASPHIEHLYVHFEQTPGVCSNADIGEDMYISI